MFHFAHLQGNANEKHVNVDEGEKSHPLRENVKCSQLGEQLVGVLTVQPNKCAFILMENINEADYKSFTHTQSRVEIT